MSELKFIKPLKQGPAQNKWSVSIVSAITVSIIFLPIQGEKCLFSAYLSEMATGLMR